MRLKARVLLGLFALGLLPFLLGAAGQDQRGSATGRYALEIDGVIAGWVEDVSGGNAVVDVVTEKVGSDGVQRKHIGNVKYEEISFKVGNGMSKQFYQWIKHSFDHAAARKDGAIIAVDYNQKEISRLNFSGALLTEVGMPALDAASKDAAKMTIKVTPQWDRRVPGTGKPVNVPTDKLQKQWLPANFRLRIDGLEQATSRVNKIDALVVKQKVVEHAVGELRGSTLEPAVLEIPNLVFSLDEADAWSLYDWHEDFVIKGNSGQANEKSGTLEYLAPDQKQVLFTLTFSHLGVVQVAPESTGDNIRRVKAELYCEEIGFSAQAE